MLRWGKMPPQLSALTPRGNQTNYVELLILSPRDIYCGVVVVFIVFNLQIASKWNALSGCRTLKINRRDATDTTYYLVLCWCPDILLPSLTISYHLLPSLTWNHDFYWFLSISHVSLRAMPSFQELFPWASRSSPGSPTSSWCCVRPSYLLHCVPSVRCWAKTSANVSDPEFP